MPSKSGVIVCPNPKCHREFEEPILLNNLSSSPTEQYHACPYCFVKLDTDTENKEDAMEEPRRGPHLPPSLEESQDLEPAKLQEPEESQDLEPEELQEPEEKPPAEPSKEEEKGPKGCPHYFGYLTQRPKDASIPQKCLTCPKIVECMLKL